MTGLGNAARQAADGFRELADREISLELTEVITEAQSRWPDDTGRSAASLRVEDASVASDVRYVEFIRGGSTWTDLVVKPTEAAAEPIAESIARRAVLPFVGV